MFEKQKQFFFIFLFGDASGTEMIPLIIPNIPLEMSYV